jgi:aspartyl-tRNA synthetase
MTYEHAMKTYGNDKDIRFGMEFGELNEVAKTRSFLFSTLQVVVGIAVPSGNYRKEIDALIEWVKRPQVGAWEWFM